MKLAHLILLATSSCGSGTACPGSLVSSDLASGTASLALGTGVTVTATQFVWLNGSPTRFPSTSFQVDFQTSDGVLAFVGCSQKWSTLNASAQPVSIAEWCTLVVERPDAHGGYTELSASLTTGTITTTPALDSNGNGALTLQLDVPSTPLVLLGNDFAETVTLAMNALVVTASFDTRECPASCSGGINPVI